MCNSLRFNPKCDSGVIITDLCGTSAAHSIVKRTVTGALIDRFWGDFTLFFVSLYCWIFVIQIHCAVDQRRKGPLRTVMKPAALRKEKGLFKVFS